MIFCFYVCLHAASWAAGHVTCSHAGVSDTVSSLSFILSSVCVSVQPEGFKRSHSCSFYYSSEGSPTRTAVVPEQQRSGAAEVFNGFLLLLVIFPSVLLLFFLVVFYAFLSGRQVATPPLPPPALPLRFPTAMIPWKGGVTPVGSFFLCYL